MQATQSKQQLETDMLRAHLDRIMEDQKQMYVDHAKSMDNLQRQLGMLQQPRQPPEENPVTPTTEPTLQHPVPAGRKKYVWKTEEIDYDDMTAKQKNELVSRLRKQTAEINNVACANLTN